MKVKELIEELSQMDGEAMVVVSGYEGGVDEVAAVGKVVIALNVNCIPCYGTHEVVSEVSNACVLEKLEKCDAIRIG